MDEDLTPEENGEPKDEKEEKSISADLIRGHINTIILRALYDGDKYGYAIIAEIERKSHGQYSLKQPSLYSALKRLEKDGYITSYWGGSVGGGRRKYFSLTEEGKEIAETNQAEWEYSRTVIDSLISDKEFDFNNPAPTAVNMRILRSSTSRVPSGGEEDEELDYEPMFDDSEERQRIASEFEQRNADFEAEKAKFEEEKKQFEEEMRARNAAYFTERDWREKELAERERILDEKRKQLDELSAQYDADRASAQAMAESDFAAEEAEFDERVRLFEEREETWRQEAEAAEEARKQELEAEETARKEQIEAEESARKQAFEEEEAVRRAALEAEESERRRILDEEESARRQALEDEETSRRQALEDEETSRRQALEDEETSRRQALEDEENSRREALEAEIEARRRALDEEEEAEKLRREASAAEDSEKQARAEDELRFREEQLRNREAFYVEERNRYTQLLQQRDEQLASERRAHEEALVAQEQRIIREQQELFRAHTREILHQNYCNLVNKTPVQQSEDAFTYYTTPNAEASPAQPAPAPAAPADYREVLDPIYRETMGDRLIRPEESAQAANGIVFDDVNKMAARDKIRVTTVGGAAVHKAQDTSENTVHKGKALFLSAVVVFCLCMIEGGIVFALRDRYSVSLFHPCFIWCAGLALLLVTMLAYANHFGRRSIRRKAPVIINAVVIYALCAIVTLIVALWVDIDFKNLNALMNFIIIPIVFFFGIVVFGICYYFLTRPKKNS